MKMIIQAFFSIMLVYFLCSADLYAQESTNTAGGNANGLGGTVSYSIGQVAFSTISNNNVSLSQGVQQAYEIYNIGINETSTNITLGIFPNPTSDFVILEVGCFSNQKLTYQLLDANNREVNRNQISSYQTLIPMENHKNGTYFLNVSNEFKKPLQTFKIIKSH